MKLIDFVPPVVSKWFTNEQEIKSHFSNQLWPASFTEFLLTDGNDDLSAFSAIQLYMSVMPFNNAVSMRSDGFSAIPPRLWDTEKNEFLEGGEPLELLKLPNADVSRTEFFESMSSYFDITGDSFILATGRVENPPLELATVPPQSVQMASTSNKFGILHVPDFMNVTKANGGIERFEATEDPDMGLRYMNKDRDLELWHIRAFNPLRSNGRFRGMSKARPIWMELQQYASGNMTNLSMLKRGTRLSMAWVNNRGEELTEVQWDRLQEEAQKYKGDMNAGGTPILDGMDIKEIQANNREMEYTKIHEAMLARVSTQYRIPLALLLEKTMTFNNLQTSFLQLFDGAVLPLTSKMYAELSRFLLPRYKNMENVIFQFNENDIEPVRLRMIETAKAQKEIDVNTTNEIRTVIGYEGIDEGNDVLVGLDKVPLGSDTFVGDNRSTPGSPGTADKFIHLMREVKDKDGERKYTDQEISAMASYYYKEQPADEATQ